MGGAVVHAASVSAQTETTVVLGSLAHHRFSNDLFHIEGLWMLVQPDSVFHRWLMRGANRTAAVALTSDPDRFADQPNVKVLTGRLIHQTAPSASPVLHMFFLRDEWSGTLGPVTFETKDPVIAWMFDQWADSTVSIVIEIRPEMTR